MNTIERAFSQIPRKQFMPLAMRIFAGFDAPQPIGHGQTISQPTLVAQMLEWLEVQPGDRVLDIGSGSGWTTALLSVLVGAQGHVYAIEIIPELVEVGRKNCEHAGAQQVSFHQASGVLGLPSEAPFDRILVSAALESGEVPAGLLDQLKPGGKLVMPIANDIVELHKSADGSVSSTRHSGYSFVPLIT